MQETVPQTEEEVLEIVQDALSREAPLRVEGLGTKSGLGHAVEAERVLSLKGLNGILAYEPGELVISAFAGTPMAEIEAAIAAEGQHLAFDPPDYGGIFGVAGKGTLGGHVAAALSGPRRVSAGAVRDHVLGLEGVTGRGEAFRIGGRVVKNVTGYDLSKLLTGSFGTLAVMTRITLKVLPNPETSRTLEFKPPDSLAGLRWLREGMASPYSPTGAALSDGSAFLRLEGRADEIDRRARLLQEHLGCDALLLDDKASGARWQRLKDLQPLAVGQTLWRINLARSAAPELVFRLQADGIPFMADWAGARLWVASDNDMRGLAIDHGGKAMLFQADAETKVRFGVFHPPAPAVAALESRVRDAFDPARILNPGRLGAR